jgi:uncharacterized repeat protein (TIGR01451 family)
VKLTPAAGVTLKPGDIVRYDVTATNTGDSAAAGVRPLDQIPPGTAYVEGSAAGPGTVEFSLDHGKTWSALPMVVVRDGGVERSVKADPATYTTIRWTMTNALKPAASERFLFEVLVR